MRMFRIKMTAARTNPQQIREVRIDSEKTVGELLELVRIVYEYGDVRGSLLNEAGASQSPETKLFVNALLEEDSGAFSIGVVL